MYTEKKQAEPQILLEADSNCHGAVCKALYDLVPAYLSVSLFHPSPVDKGSGKLLEISST